MNKKQVLFMGGAAAVSFLMAVPAFAATTTATSTESASALHTHKGAHKKHTAHAAFGTVASVNGSTFTLSHKTKTGTKTVTITTTSSTVYKENGKVSTSAVVAVGQRVVVMGTKDTSGDISSAKSVNILIRKSAS
jgi:hypothetical protein